MISPRAMEALEHAYAKNHPLRALFLADGPGGGKPEWTYNMLLRHGVRSALEYAKSFDLERSRALSNPQLAPHLEFVGLGGHGYAKVRLTGDERRTEFVCIPRPITRSASPDGGPIRYRVAPVAKLWRPGERPRLEVQFLECTLDCRYDQQERRFVSLKVTPLFMALPRYTALSHDIDETAPARANSHALIVIED